MNSRPAAPMKERQGKGWSPEEPLDLRYFQACFGELADPVLVMDMQRRVLFLNDAAKALTGCSASIRAPVDLSRILRTDSEGEGGSPFERCLNRKISRHLQAQLRNCRGDWLPFSIAAQVVRNPAGNPIGYVAVARDAFSSPSGARDHIHRVVFPSIIDNFPLPFFTVDSTLTVSYMNEHLEKLTGYSRHEVVNRMTCAELFRTSFCNTDGCILKQAMKNKTSLSGIRSLILDREDRQIRVSVHATIITDRRGNVIGGFKAIREITSNLEAEEKIRMLIDITQEGILMADEDNRVIYANKKMAEILDYAQHDLIGKDVREVLPSQLMSLTQDLVQKVSPEQPQALRFCSTIQHSETLQQEFKAFETCIVASRIGKSLITCIYFHDLTNYIEVERQLYNANSFLNNIIMSSADGIVVIDTEGNIVIFNAAAETILGYSASEVVGARDGLAKIYTAELARDVMRQMRAYEHGKLTSTRVTLRRKDGEEVPVNFSAAIIKKEGREIGIVSIFSDLRERLRIRRELEEARTQLMQADKIASIGRLAAGIAHEINNPLSGILIYADLLQKEMSQNPQFAGDLQEIIDQTLRCKEIVARLLDFSRQSVGQRLMLDINVIINRSIELLANQALFHNVEFALDLRPQIPPITGDPGQLQQVFTNLIINAGSAMQGKGRISITSAFDAESGQVVLKFADTGPGIAPEIESKIFDPFFTTKGPGEGTGLGLSVAYGIIQQHGGNMTAKNSPSGGAVFTITLPLDCPETQTEHSEEYQRS